MIVCLYFVIDFGAWSAAPFSGPSCAPVEPRKEPYHMHRIFPDSRRKGWILTLFVLISLGAFISVQFTSNPVRASSTGPSFLEFESGQVRPIAMSPDGTKLF